MLYYLQVDISPPFLKEVMAAAVMASSCSTEQFYQIWKIV